MRPSSPAAANQAGSKASAAAVVREACVNCGWLSGWHQATQSGGICQAQQPSADARWGGRDEGASENKGAQRVTASAAWALGGDMGMGAGRAGCCAALAPMPPEPAGHAGACSDVMNQ